MSLFNRRPIRRDRQGSYVVTLGSDERALLRSLPGQMRAALASPEDPTLARLFPPAYQAEEDKEREEDYRRLMYDDLLASHHEALATLEASAGAETLSGEELDGWLRALNAVRLLLGTRLGVTEDDQPGGQLSPEEALYHFLGYLQECALDALCGEG